MQGTKEGIKRSLARRDGMRRKGLMLTGCELKEGMGEPSSDKSLPYLGVIRLGACANREDSGGTFVGGVIKVVSRIVLELYGNFNRYVSHSN